MRCEEWGVGVGGWGVRDGVGQWAWGERGAEGDRCFATRKRWLFVGPQSYGTLGARTGVVRGEGGDRRMVAGRGTASTPNRFELGESGKIDAMRQSGFTDGFAVQLFRAGDPDPKLVASPGAHNFHRFSAYWIGDRMRPTNQ